MQQSHAYNDTSLALTTAFSSQGGKNLSCRISPRAPAEPGFRHRRPARPASAAGNRAQVVGDKLELDADVYRRCKHPVARQPQRCADRPDHLPFHEMTRSTAHPQSLV